MQLGADWCNLVQFGAINADWCNLGQIAANWYSFVQLSAV